MLHALYNKFFVIVQAYFIDDIISQNMMIPLVDLKAQYVAIRKEIDKAINNVISQTAFINGKEVTDFENAFAKYLSAKHCITVNSGTDALILGMRALRLSPGDEVLVPVNTFIATALAASENDLKPVFVDIDKRDHGFNLEDLKKKITNKTKAIILVHLYGQSEKIRDIQEIIKKTGKKIYIIEDAAQAHGAMYNNKKVGTFGIFSVFSFYPGKNLGAYGDAGAFITNNPVLAKRFRLLKEYGQVKKYKHVSIGINSRMDTIQAAVLHTKLNHLDIWNKKRQEKAAIYSKKIKKVLPFLKTPQEFSERKSIYHVYVVQVKKRDKLLKYLNTHGVQALIHYPIPLHLQKAYKYLGYKKGDFPHAEKMAKEIISLPIFPELRSTQISAVVALMQSFYEKN